MFDPAGLQNLLDLADSIIDQGDGYWVKKVQMLKDFFIEVDQVLALAKLK
jgi:hypothetical protein